MTGPTHVGAPDRLIIGCPFKPIIFKPFRSRTGLANILRADVQTAVNFSVEIFVVWKPELTSFIFSMIPGSS